MKPYLLSEYGNPSQPYSFSRAGKRALKDARNMIADCIHAEPEEIYFTSGGSESDNWAIKGMMSYGDHRATLTSQIEHHAVLRACAGVEQMGFPVVYLPVDTQGVVKPDILRNYITNRTKLVSIMFANNEIGTIEPISELAEISHVYGATFHTDAVQAVGHVPIDVKELNVDMLSASAHKFNGPKGVGFLYVKQGTSLGPYLSGGSQERGLRAGTENVAGIVAMAYALQKNCVHMQENLAKGKNFEQDLLRELRNSGIDFIRNGSEERIPGNVNISFRGCEGETLLHRLDLMGICVSTGSACDSKRTQVSHVLEAIKLDEDYAFGTIRVSFGANNHPDDGRLVGKALSKILKTYGQ
jgi:cysteine desulfurase